MNNGIFRSELECILTDPEIKTYSGELARLTQEQAETEDRKKQITADFKAKIDACIAKTRVIARKVSSGKEMREVEVRWNFDFMANVKVLERLDTFEIIDTKALTENERQMCLDLEAKAEEEFVEPEEMTELASDVPEFDEEATDVIDPPAEDSFECQDCRKKKKARICGADCRQA